MDKGNMLKGKNDEEAAIQADNGRASQAGSRIWELDFLRALAICLMVIFHTVFDLTFYYGYDINIDSRFWYWEGKLAALVFIFLSGASAGLSRRSSVRRGLYLILIGLGISLVTFIIMPDVYIRFGILHFLGLCLILYPALVRIDNYSLLIIGMTTALLPLAFRTMIFDSPWLLPFGLVHRGFNSVDYYPLAPYLGVFILGILAYKVFYYQRRSLLPSLDFLGQPPIINYLSRNSLIIYIVHQPVVVVVLALLDYFNLLP